MTEQPLPPLPKLAMDKEIPLTVALNEWQSLVQTVSMFAEPLIFAPTNTGSETGPSRYSRFRTGTIYLDESGISMNGLAVRLFPLWFPLVSGIGSFCLPICSLVCTLGKHMGLPLVVQTILGLLMAVFLICQLILSGYLNRQRVETKLFLAWESMHGLHVDSAGKQITLVYTSLAVPQSGESLREYITLKKLDPNTVRGVITTILQFAPHVSCVDTEDNPKRRLWWVVVLSSMTFVFVVALVLLYMRRHHML